MCVTVTGVHVLYRYVPHDIHETDADHYGYYTSFLLSGTWITVKSSKICTVPNSENWQPVTKYNCSWIFVTFWRRIKNRSEPMTSSCPALRPYHCSIKTDLLWLPDQIHITYHSELVGFHETTMKLDVCESNYRSYMPAACYAKQ